MGKRCRRDKKCRLFLLTLPLLCGIVEYNGRHAIYLHSFFCASQGAVFYRTLAMENTMTTDYEILRIQFEMFGQSLEEIAEEQGIPLSRLTYAAEAGGWTQSNLPALPDRTSEITKASEIQENLLEDIEDRLKFQHVVKTSSLSPRYVGLEALILNKALEFVKYLAPDQPQGVEKLQKLSTILNSLKEKNATINNNSGKDQAQDGGGLRIAIVNKVVQTPEGNTTTVVDVPLQTAVAAG